jgi:hypothetical protein
MRKVLNAGSTVSTSGSGYVMGGAPGPKSRGGVETVEGGSAAVATERSCVVLTAVSVRLKVECRVALHDNVRG